MRTAIVVVGAAIIVAAAGIALVTRDTTKPTPPIAAADVSPAILAVVHRFVRTAVARRHTVASYDIVHPELRGGVTREQWATGNIPVVNFPAEGDITIEPKYVEPDDVLLEVGLTPTAGYGLKPLTFLIGLKRVFHGQASRWLVYYWVPHYGVGTPPAR